MSAASIDAAPIDAASLWPELDRTCAYINAASRTPLPACVLAAGEAAVRRKAATPWDIGDTEAQKEEVRTLFGECSAAASPAATWRSSRAAPLR